MSRYNTYNNFVGFAFLSFMLTHCTNILPNQLSFSLSVIFLCTARISKKITMKPHMLKMNQNVCFLYANRVLFYISEMQVSTGNDS